MNSSCPSCGAVYAVTAKDIGRKIKCKKCSTALRVDDTGLVADVAMPAAAAPAGPFAATAPAAPAAAILVEDDADFSTPVANSRSKGARKYSGGGNALDALGGIPTLLFSLGVFLVIWFTFMTPIGEASTQRVSAGLLQLKNQQRAEIKKLLPQGKRSPFELSPEDQKTYNDKKQKIDESYTQKLEDAGEAVSETQVSNVRAVYFEKYGQLLGFLLLAFGCIGYLRTEQPLVMRIVAGTILASMMLVVFVSAGGCGAGPRLPSINPPNLEG